MEIEGQPENSPQRSIFLRLGGFHTETSFIGSIGHLMSGSGLHELLETIYANNVVTHMLTGKAVQRAFRGLLLVDSALSTMIVSDEFNAKAPCIAPAQDITKMEDKSSLYFQIKSYMKQKRHVPGILARQHRHTLKQLEICSMKFCLVK